MRSLVQVAFFLLAIVALMGVAEFLGSIPFFGWLYGLGLVALPIALMVKVAKK